METLYNLTKAKIKIIICIKYYYENYFYTIIYNYFKIFTTNIMAENDLELTAGMSKISLERQYLLDSYKQQIEFVKSIKNPNQEEKSFLESLVLIQNPTIIDYQDSYIFAKTLPDIILEHNKPELLTTIQITSQIRNGSLDTYCNNNKIGLIHPNIKYNNRRDIKVKYYFEPNYKKDGMNGAFMARDIDYIEISSKGEPYLSIIDGIITFLSQKGKEINEEDKSNLYNYLTNLQGKTDKDKKIFWHNQSETIKILYYNENITIVYPNITERGVSNSIHKISVINNQNNK